VNITPDKKGVYITIRVEEGKKFDVGEVDFSGDLMFSKEELYDSVTIDESKVFVWEKMQKDMSSLQAKYGDLGYAYANIIPRTNVRENDLKVDVVFHIERGNKVYFGQINVKNNSRTRDKVIRRELLIKEGELYSETKRRESMQAIQRLGFFEDVQFNPSTPLDNPDIMNVDIVVKERNTGSLQVSAGYSTYSQFIFGGQVNQTNLFGRGQSLGLSVDYSRLQSLFNLNFTEPYLFDTNWSFGVDAYKSRRIREEFLDDRAGGALRLGHPLSRYLRGYVRYKLDETEVILDPVWGDPVLFPVETVNGITSSVTFTLEYDRRNDRFMPTDGVFTTGSLEYAGLGGDLQYTKGFYALRYYKKVFWEFVFRNNVNYGFIATTSDREPPFTELYRLGGPYSLRGFQFGSVGKRVFSPNVRDTLLARGEPLERANQRANVVFGGRQQFFYNAEIEFPLISEAGVRGVVFFDIGEADDVLRFADLRSNFGMGFRWFSPIGPLRFEWGFPLDRKAEYDESPTNFEFSIGAPF
jgi:outer membrane protein insertion porin family